MQTVNGSNGNTIQVGTECGNIAVRFTDGQFHNFKQDDRLKVTKSEVTAAAKANKHIPKTSLRIVVALSRYLGRTVSDTWRAISSASLAVQIEGQAGTSADSTAWYHNQPIDPDGILPDPDGILPDADQAFEVADLWKHLGDVPVDDDGITQEAFHNFPAGTNRETIWRWLESTFGVSVADLMGVAA